MFPTSNWIPFYLSHPSYQCCYNQYYKESQNVCEGKYFFIWYLIQHWQHGRNVLARSKFMCRCETNSWDSSCKQRMCFKLFVHVIGLNANKSDHRSKVEYFCPLAARYANMRLDYVDMQHTCNYVHMQIIYARYMLHVKIMMLYVHINSYSRT